jgi:hypothetical protein
LGLSRSARRDGDYRCLDADPLQAEEMAVIGIISTGRDSTSGPVQRGQAIFYTQVLYPSGTLELFVAELI